MNLYSAYDYLAFVIPGGLAIGSVEIAWFGWPTGEPGALGLAVLLGLAFLVGHILATMAAWAQPLAWGHRPGAPANPLWGVFGHGAIYSDDEQRQIVGELMARYGSALAEKRLYQLAYTELQQAGKEARLLSLNSQIGFCRNSAIAFVIGATAQLVAQIVGHGTAQSLWLVPAYMVGALVFIARYKRFWRQFGDNVIRGFRVLRVTAAQGAKT